MVPEKVIVTSSAFNVCLQSNRNPKWRTVIKAYFYFLSEVIPQFFTALCVISAILVVSQLIRLSEVLVAFGLSFENIMFPFLFIILPFLSFTIPIAYLFGVLIGFLRLSADGELPGFFAAGFSLWQAAKPILATSLVLFGIGAICGLYLEPWGRREFISFYQRKAQGELDNVVKYKLKSGVFLEDFLGYVLYTEKISHDKTSFENVMMAPGPATKNQPFTLFAPVGSLTGSVDHSDLKMVFESGTIHSREPGSLDASVLKFKRAEIDLMRVFQTQMFTNTDSPGSVDYRAITPGQLWRYIGDMDKKRSESAVAEAEYKRARFLFHQRAATPFSTVFFAMFAMVLGVTDPRRGKGGAYFGAILTVVVGYLLLMGFKWFAENSDMSAPMAAWLPNIVMLLAGSFALYQKNRLPASEPLLNFENLPYVRHLQQNRRSKKNE